MNSRERVRASRAKYSVGIPVSHVAARAWCFKHGYANSLPRLKIGKFNICYPAKTLVPLSWILFGRPFDRNWLTMQPLFCYIFKRSSACDWLFLLTTLHSLWKRAKCSPRQSKNSKIFPGEHAPGPPYKFVSSLPKCTPPPLHEKPWLRAWESLIEFVWKHRYPIIYTGNLWK